MKTHWVPMSTFHFYTNFKGGRFMPIGVPKVEYRLPGEAEADWIDLYNCLYRERMLFLCQDLDDEVANQLISLMLYLNAEDPSQPFFMYINSLGGSVTCGIGVYDIMRYLHSGITTICMGTASSMASFVLAGGTYGRRLSLPNGRIMIHQPEGGGEGQASEILSESSEVNRIRKQIGIIYATRTQQSIERIARDMDRDQFMSADEARSYGLIDFVARTSNELNVDLDILKLLRNEPSAPQQFRALASAQSMEQAQQAIRNLAEPDDSELDSWRSFGEEDELPFAVVTTLLPTESDELELSDSDSNSSLTQPDEIIDEAVRLDASAELRLFVPDMWVLEGGTIRVESFRSLNDSDYDEPFTLPLPPEYQNASSGDGAGKDLFGVASSSVPEDGMVDTKPMSVPEDGLAPEDDLTPESDLVGATT